MNGARRTTTDDLMRHPGLSKRVNVSNVSADPLTHSPVDLTHHYGLSPLEGWVPGL